MGQNHHRFSPSMSCDLDFFLFYKKNKSSCMLVFKKKSKSLFQENGWYIRFFCWPVYIYIIYYSHKEILVFIGWQLSFVPATLFSVLNFQVLFSVIKRWVCWLFRISQWNHFSLEYISLLFGVINYLCVRVYALFFAKKQIHRLNIFKRVWDFLISVLYVVFLHVNASICIYYCIQSLYISLCVFK